MSGTLNPTNVMIEPFLSRGIFLSKRSTFPFHVLDTEYSVYNGIKRKSDHD